MSEEEAKPKGYKVGPTRLLQFSDKQILEHIGMTTDPLCLAALREVLFLRREIEKLNRAQV